MPSTASLVTHIFLCLFLTCGLVANLFVLFVFYRFKKIRTRPSSASLIALTSFDLLMCASTVFLFINQSLEDPERGTNVLYCHMMYCAMLIFMLCSCFIIVYIAFDRLYATTWPLAYRSKAHVKHTKIVAIVSFVLSTIVYSFVFIYFLVLVLFFTGTYGKLFEMFNGNPGPTVLDSVPPLASNVQCVINGLWPSYFLTIYLIVSETLSILLVLFYLMARYKLHQYNKEFLAQCDDPQSAMYRVKRQQEIKMSQCILWTTVPYLCLFAAPCTFVVVGLVTDYSWLALLGYALMGLGALLNSSLNLFVYGYKLPDFKTCALEALGKKQTAPITNAEHRLHSVPQNVKINTFVNRSTTTAHRKSTCIV